jgi:ribosomal protein S18 acetylase RimI-like enzyme
MRICRAAADDIKAIAALFTVCFHDSVIHHCGRLPKPQAMEDVFALVYQAEPAAALVAKDDDDVVVGYCFAPTRLSSLWRLALTGGHVFRWAWRWITGQYGFGLHPVTVIVLNKVAFLRSSLVPAQAADARILSIAVHPAARGQGVAQALLAEALIYFQSRQVERVRLEVRPDNLPAVRVYEKCGFYPGGKTTDSQGDWHIMYKEMRQR